jgi:hypothetical protein
MMNVRYALKGLSLLIFMFALTSLAHAQATRTWVSGVGDDVNPCSRTAPCKTFAGAISKTAVGGEIDALDPGGFGGVTINKSLTIDGTGTLASILSASITGVNVNDSASGTPNTAVVTLRNISINGVGSGVNGINFTSGKTVNVEGCFILGHPAAAANGAGIRVALTVSGGNLNVTNTSIFNNRVGISATTTTGSVTVNVNGCNIENHSSDGIFLDARASGTIRNSNIAFNGGAGVSLNNGAVNSVTIDSSEVNHNNIGVFVGTGTTARLGHSTFIQNTTNFTNNGTIVTYLNNETDSATIPGVLQSPGQK